MVSDRLKVRKPFMLLGGVCAVATGLIFASLATHPHTSYGTFVIVIMLMSASRGIAYAPWMAAYTETLESRNPALVATGLAIWGWILRLVAAASFLIVPFIVPSATPVADYGPQAAALQTRYGTQIATLKLVDPVTLAQLQADSTNRRTIVAAAEQISRGAHVSPVVAIASLQSAAKIPSADRMFLSTHGREVLAARMAAPKEWQRWWYVCVVGDIAFLPTIFLLVGRWRRSSAVRDEEAHDQTITSEFEGLASSDQYIEGLPN
jgi:hypothetical protein